jgi:hypothetical protein
MHRCRFGLAFAGVLGGCLLATPSAQAHIDLLSPAPRVHGIPDSTLSRGPCGQRDDGRLPDRVSVFSPGQSIEVVWDVYVQHVSYFRIAFDAEGADSFSTRTSLPADAAADEPTLLAPAEGETILAYIEDHTGDIDHVEQQVTLPDVACDQCTLQVTQFTYGLPLRDATYYQCADLVLAGPSAGGGVEAQGAEGASRGAPGLDPLTPDTGGAGGCALSPATGARPGSGAGLGSFASLALLVGAALRQLVRRGPSR